MAAIETGSGDFATSTMNDTTFSPNLAATDKDPFAAERTNDNDPFAAQRDEDGATDLGSSPPQSPGDMPRDRRMSKEWDASKVPPSRFQRREGSIYATPGSRDGHTKGKDRDQGYHDKLKEKGWVK